MKLGDLLIFIPGAVISTAAKTIKTRIPEQTKEYVEQNHLYHFTRDKETAGMIMDSGYLKPGSKISSYGKEACFMFAGIPNMDSFIKNMSISPYIEPERIIRAVEIDVKKEELNNYKVRPFADEAVLYEGYCVLPKERTKIVEMVADLKRDDKGNPIIDNKTGELAGIELRPRTEEEIQENPDRYIPKEDYIKFVIERRKQYGLIKGDGELSRKYNYISTALAGGKLEYNETVRSTKKNFSTVIKGLVERLKNRNKLLDENSNTKIGNIIYGKKFLNRKNPYLDKKFALAVTEFQKRGLIQCDLEECLPEFVNSKDGLFLREKCNQIDKTPIRQSGIHGIKHNDRVAMLALMIGQGEGILKEDSTRERELLTTAAYYHDIGRIVDIGPHARRSARLIKKTELNYLDGKKFNEEDKKIVQLLAEGHEGRDDKVPKLIKKYKIEQTDVEMVEKLLKVLKDADALDRSRLSINTPIKTITDLDPNFLRLNTSKRLMEVSYGLEALTKKVSTTDIQNYKNENLKKHYHKKTNKIDEIKVNQETKEKIELNRQKSMQNENESKILNNNEERED